MVQINPTFGELDKNIHGFKIVVLICPLLPLTPEDPVSVCQVLKKKTQVYPQSFC